MPSFDSAFVTDKKLEKEGVWHEIGGGVKIKVARIGTFEYANTLRNLTAPHRSLTTRASEEGEIDAHLISLMKRIEAKAMAEHVLVDWDGFTETDDPDSPKVPYSQEKAEEYLLASDDFRTLVVNIAKQASNFKASRLRGTQGN